jgi:hypothetical protein
MHHLDQIHELTSSFHFQQIKGLLSPPFNSDYYVPKWSFMDHTHREYTENFCVPSIILVSWDSAVSIETSYRLDDRGVRVGVPVGSRIFTSPCCPDQLWSPPNLLSNGYWGLFPRGVKWLEREADHSPLTSAEVKKTWVYSSTPLYTFMA